MNNDLADPEVYSHHAFLLTLNDRLLLAPIHNPKRALDIGCGVGTWTMLVHWTSV